MTTKSVGRTLAAGPWARSDRRFPAARLAAAALLLTVLAGCGTASPAGSEAGGGSKSTSKEIIAIFYTRTLEYYETMVTGMKDAATKRGYSITSQYANFDITQQVEMVRNALSKRPAGIVLAPLQSQAFVPVLQEVKRAGIPIVLVANDVPDEATQDRLSFVGPDNYDTGKRKAEWLAEQLGGQGEVVVIHFIRGHPFTEAQRRAYEEVFKKYPGISVVEGPYGSSSAEGLTATENVLSTHPKPAGIFFDGDDVALGGIKALKERGLAGRVVTVASDGTTAAVQAVRNGDLDLTISVRPYKTGTDAVDVLVNYVEDGTQPSPKMYAPLLEITRQTVDGVPPEEMAR